MPLSKEQLNLIYKALEKIKDGTLIIPNDRLVELYDTLGKHFFEASELADDETVKYLAIAVELIKPEQKILSISIIYVILSHLINACLETMQYGKARQLIESKGNWLQLFPDQKIKILELLKTLEVVKSNDLKSCVANQQHLAIIIAYFNKTPSNLLPDFRFLYALLHVHVLHLLRTNSGTTNNTHRVLALESVCSVASSTPAVIPVNATNSTQEELALQAICNMVELYLTNGQLDAALSLYQQINCPNVNEKQSVVHLIQTIAAHLIENEDYLNAISILSPLKMPVIGKCYGKGKEKEEEKETSFVAATNINAIIHSCWLDDRFNNQFRDIYLEQCVLQPYLENIMHPTLYIALLSDAIIKIQKSQAEHEVPELALLFYKLAEAQYKYLNAQCGTSSLADCLDNYILAQEFAALDPEPKTAFKPPIIRGLTYLEVPGDGNCLFSAVGLYVGQDQKVLRENVVTYIEKNLNDFREFIKAELKSEQTIEAYLKAIRETNEWADHTVIEALMRLLGQPIIIFGPNGIIRNRDVLDKFKNTKPLKPIIVLYNGYSHYDSFLIKDGFTYQDILDGCYNVGRVSSQIQICLETLNTAQKWVELDAEARRLKTSNLLLEWYIKNRLQDCNQPSATDSANTNTVNADKNTVRPGGESTRDQSLTSPAVPSVNTNSPKRLSSVRIAFAVAVKDIPRDFPYKLTKYDKQYDAEWLAACETLIKKIDYITNKHVLRVIKMLDFSRDFDYSLRVSLLYFWRAHSESFNAGIIHPASIFLMFINFYLQSRNLRLIEKLFTSQAYRVLNNPEYLIILQAWYQYLQSHFTADTLSRINDAAIDMIANSTISNMFELNYLLHNSVASEAISMGFYDEAAKRIFLLAKHLSTGAKNAKHISTIMGKLVIHDEPLFADSSLHSVLACRLRAYLKILQYVYESNKFTLSFVSDSVITFIQCAIDKNAEEIIRWMFDDAHPAAVDSPNRFIEILTSNGISLNILFDFVNYLIEKGHKVFTAMLDVNSNQFLFSLFIHCLRQQNYDAAINILFLPHKSICKPTGSLFTTCMAEKHFTHLLNNTKLSMEEKLELCKDGNTYLFWITFSTLLLQNKDPVNCSQVIALFKKSEDRQKFTIRTRNLPHLLEVGHLVFLQWILLAPDHHRGLIKSMNCVLEFNNYRILVIALCAYNLLNSNIITFIATRGAVAVEEDCKDRPLIFLDKWLLFFSDPNNKGYTIEFFINIFPKIPLICFENEEVCKAALAKFAAIPENERREMDYISLLNMGINENNLQRLVKKQ